MDLTIFDEFFRYCIMVVLTAYLATYHDGNSDVKIVNNAIKVSSFSPDMLPIRKACYLVFIPSFLFTALYDTGIIQ